MQLLPVTSGDPGEVMRGAARVIGRAANRTPGVLGLVYVQQDSRRDHAPRGERDKSVVHFALLAAIARAWRMPAKPYRLQPGGP
jgi:hypothetical protein